VRRSKRIDISANRWADWAMNPLRSNAHVYENGKAFHRGTTKYSKEKKSPTPRHWCFVLVFRQ
ncbi:hypothetical protein ACVGWR_04265, partial [Enterobacter hormaechei]